MVVVMEGEEEGEEGEEEDEAADEKERECVCEAIVMAKPQDLPRCTDWTIHANEAFRSARAMR